MEHKRLWPSPPSSSPAAWFFPPPPAGAAALPRAYQADPRSKLPPADVSRSRRDASHKQRGPAFERARSPRIAARSSCATTTTARGVAAPRALQVARDAEESGGRRRDTRSRSNERTRTGDSTGPWNERNDAAALWRASERNWARLRPTATPAVASATPRLEWGGCVATPPLQLHAPAPCARGRMRNLCSPLAFLPLHARMFLMFEDKGGFRGMDIRVSGWKGGFLERGEKLAREDSWEWWMSGMECV